MDYLDEMTLEDIAMYADEIDDALNGHGVVEGVFFNGEPLDRDKW